MTISCCVFLLMVFLLAARALHTKRRFRTGFRILGASFFFEADDTDTRPAAAKYEEPAVARKTRIRLVGNHIRLYFNKWSSPTSISVGANQYFGIESDSQGCQRRCGRACVSAS